MSSSLSKKEKNKKSSSTPINNSTSNILPQKNIPLMKNNDIPLPHFNTSDQNFLTTMEQLVSNDKNIREKAAHKAKTYLHSSYSNCEELYQKISRSLFYFFWNSDKPAYQLSMAKLVSSFIYINPDDKTKLIPKYRLWISTFLTEMSKKFQNIDVLRLDKYIMMCDQVMSSYLNACLENKLFKSIIYLIKYFIKESESNNNFNFTFEANKIKVISRFLHLIFNTDDKIEGNIKNKDEFLYNEESGFAAFYKKLLIFYKNIKDKRAIKNFNENIFETILNGLIENKKIKNNKKFLDLYNLIQKETENFEKNNNQVLFNNKNLTIEYVINKLKDEKYEKIDNDNKNVLDPVNDYILQKKYLQKFRKSKEEIKKEKLEKKQKNMDKNDNDKNNDLKDKDKNENEKKDKNSDKKNKKEKKEKLDKIKNIENELNFDDVKMEEQIIDLNEEKEELKNKETPKKDKKENKEIKNDEKSSSKKDKKKEKIQDIEIEKKPSPKKQEKMEPIKKKLSEDDDYLIEDSDESEEELIEEDDDDDSSENPPSKDEKEKNKAKYNEIYIDESLDKYSKEMMEEEEEEPEDDEDYEIGEDDLEDLGNDMNLMLNTYNDQTTLRNTKLNMKQGLLNKKKMRNLKNERKNEINNNNKNKKKKITFSLENNVISMYNSKIPVSLKSKKKNVFVQGGSKKRSILKK